METYRLRDLRVAYIRMLLVAAFQLEPGDVARLEEELALLLPDRWVVSDTMYYSAARDALSGYYDPAVLSSSVLTDPPYFFPLLSYEQAARIIAIPAPYVGSPYDYYQQLVSALDHDTSLADRLVHGFHGAWIVTNPPPEPPPVEDYPWDDVVVSLPVRLETLFDAPDPEREEFPENWLLSLRVIPDEASIVRDFNYLGPDEREPLEAFWNEVYPKPDSHFAWINDVDPEWLDSDVAEVAWATFASQVGGERAAWLVSGIPMSFLDERFVIALDEELPDKPLPTCVRGMPPQLLIVADVKDDSRGTYRVDIGRLPEDPGREIVDEDLTMSIPRRSSELGSTWWTSFAQAREIGLGGVFPLELDIDPAKITSLYVVGVGHADPGRHFLAKAEAGELSVIPLGTATNSVKDDPAHPRPPTPDWRAIARHRLEMRVSILRPPIGETGRYLRLALTGGAYMYSAFPGHDARNDCAESQLMAQALWPTLWGHWLRDIWAGNKTAFEIGEWMMRNIAPEGPLMPIRIGDQPYGLLPAVSLENWGPDLGSNPEDPTQNEALDRMRVMLIEVRHRMAEAVTMKHNVVDGDVKKFMEMLGHPASSRRYGVRVLAPAHAFLAQQGVSQGQLQDTVDQAYTSLEPVIGKLRPVAPYVSGGYWHPVRLPLVQPRRTLKKGLEGRWTAPASMREFLEIISRVSDYIPESLSIDALFDGWYYFGGEDSEWQLSTLPDSLMFRLLVNSAQLNRYWTSDSFHTRAELATLEQNQKATIELTEKLERKDWRGEIGEEVPDPPAYTLTIPQPELSRFERAFRATLDTATHRIDPFITGYAWDRLQRAMASEQKRYRLGVYGWVDSPYRGEPGPTEAGVLHTLSYSQTLAALILRDRYLSSGGHSLLSESGQNPWHMDITSNRTRLAIEIADEVRMGFHVYEVIGRMVEQVIGTHQDVRAMRLLPEFAMRPERRDPNEVVNGEAALRRLLTGPPSFPKPDGSTYVLSTDQISAMQEIAEALDVYADLLVSDGIMQLTQRQIDNAAASMDAAAGLGRPPALQFVQTPPSGYHLSTTVVSALPYKAPPVGDLHLVHPATLVDASVASWVADRFDGDWIWTARSLGGGQPHTITRTILGLDVLDALTLSSDLVTELVLRALGLAEAEVEFPAEWRQIQETVSVLGARPLVAADLGVWHDERPAVEDAIGLDLRDRYLNLRAAATTLADDLDAATTEQECAAALRMVLPWGVVPASTPEDRESLLAMLSGVPTLAGATDPVLLCQTASAVLRARIATGPAGPGESVTDDVQPLMPTGIAEIANLVATFAAPNARLCVLSHWPVNGLLEHTDLDITDHDPTLDEQWLTVVSATRPNLARLEALQLEVSPLLHGWTSSPGDPWRVGDDNTIAENKWRRAHESVSNLDLEPFTVIYGPGDVWNGEGVALGMIDAFGEAIPMAERNTFAAFGFNAPSSRPPQAILLAVPPRPGAELNEDELLQIVRETRLSALARSARVDMLGELQATLPTAWLAAYGPLAARLEPWPIRETGKR